jgi:hypothetical protein
MQPVNTTLRSIYHNSSPETFFRKITPDHPLFSHYFSNTTQLLIEDMLAKDISTRQLSLKAAKKWQKHVVPLASNCCRLIEKLNHVMLSVSFNVPYAILTGNKNLRFIKFAVSNSLLGWMTHYGHELSYDAAGYLKLMFENNLETWESLKSKIPVNENGEMTAHHYGEMGITKKTLRERDFLIPYQKVTSPDWEGRFIYEIMIYLPAKDSFRAGGHYFFKLKGPLGYIYSAGIGINKQSPEISKLYATKVPYFTSPDPMVKSSSKKLHGLEIEITQKQFDKILAYVKDSEEACNNKQLRYRITENNCCQFIENLNKIADVNIPLGISTVSYLSLLADSYFPTALSFLARKVVDISSLKLSFLASITPRGIVKMINFIVDLILTTCGLTILPFLGGLSCSKDIKLTATYLKIPKFTDDLFLFVFKLFKSNFRAARTINHPWNLKNNIFPEIKKWREGDLANRRYSIPAHYKMIKPLKT